MSAIFDAFKQYILSHPKVSIYKPTSQNFDSEKLLEVVKKLPINLPHEDADAKLIGDFVDISEYVYKMYQEMYKYINDEMVNLNLKGIEVAEYLVAALNREYKVIAELRKENLAQQPVGSYIFTDMWNFKLKSPVEGIGLIDARATLESATDAIGLALNNVRHYIDEFLTKEDFDPHHFAASLINILRYSSQGVVFKRSYDDILYNGGFVDIDYEKKVVAFDYENRDNLKLLLAGDGIFAERKAYMMGVNREGANNSRLFTYVTNYRIKKVVCEHGCISLSFGKGEPKEHKQIALDMQGTLDAYYTFLNGSTKLPKFESATVDEALSIWVAVQYMALYSLEHLNFDVAMYTREDVDLVPRKIQKENLVEYIEKLTGIKKKYIRDILGALQADWTKFNDMWTCPLYSVGDYYLLPIFPLVFTSPYNMIDNLLQKGGIDLDARGPQFEDYIFKNLSDGKTTYPIQCLPAKVYGKKGESEEIDVLVAMKNVVLVADAKCIRYSMEPINYSEAWDRLKEGCEQAVRKADFVKSHPEYFKELGDYSYKRFIPFVITNYPTFVGFNHNGVYVTDVTSFLSYMRCGIVSLRGMSAKEDPILGFRRIYSNEDQFSDKFEGFLKENPIKKILMKKIMIHDLPVLAAADPWKAYCKSAQWIGDERFVINSKSSTSVRN